MVVAGSGFQWLLQIAGFNLSRLWRSPVVVDGNSFQWCLSVVVAEGGFQW